MVKQVNNKTNDVSLRRNIKNMRVMKNVPFKDGVWMQQEKK